MRGRRALAVGILPTMALLGTACAGDDDSDDTALVAPTSTTTSTAASPTGTPDSEPTRAARSPRPTPTLTGAASPSRTRTATPRSTRTRSSEPDPQPTRSKKPTSPSRTIVVINMYDNYFQPSSRTVKAGTYVRTVNRGDRGHTWTSGSPPDGNGAYDYDVDPGESSPLYRFTTPGTYNFFCKPHYSRLAGNMRGSITVTA